MQPAPAQPLDVRHEVSFRPRAGRFRAGLAFLWIGLVLSFVTAYFGTPTATIGREAFGLICFSIFVAPALFAFLTSGRVVVDLGTRRLLRGSQTPIDLSATRAIIVMSEQRSSRGIPLAWGSVPRTVHALYLLNDAEDLDDALYYIEQFGTESLARLPDDHRAAIERSLVPLTDEMGMRGAAQLERLRAALGVPVLRFARE